MKRNAAGTNWTTLVVIAVAASVIEPTNVGLLDVNNQAYPAPSSRVGYVIVNQPGGCGLDSDADGVPRVRSRPLARDLVACNVRVESTGLGRAPRRPDGEARGAPRTHGGTQATSNDASRDASALDTFELGVTGH
jgi:hypothetical protein